MSFKKTVSVCELGFRKCDATTLSGRTINNVSVFKYVREFGAVGADVLNYCTAGCAGNAGEVLNTEDSACSYSINDVIPVGTGSGCEQYIVVFIFKTYVAHCHFQKNSVNSVIRHEQIATSAKNEHLERFGASECERLYYFFN